MFSFPYATELCIDGTVFCLNRNKMLHETVNLSRISFWKKTRKKGSNNINMPLFDIFGTNIQKCWKCYCNTKPLRGQNKACWSSQNFKKNCFGMKPKSQKPLTGTCILHTALLTMANHITGVVRVEAGGVGWGIIRAFYQMWKQFAIKRTRIFFLFIFYTIKTSSGIVSHVDL